MNIADIPNTLDQLSSKYESLLKQYSSVTQNNIQGLISKWNDIEREVDSCRSLLHYQHAVDTTEQNRLREYTTFNAVYLVKFSDYAERVFGMTAPLTAAQQAMLHEHLAARRRNARIFERELRANDQPRLLKLKPPAPAPAPPAKAPVIEASITHTLKTLPAGTEALSLKAVTAARDRHVRKLLERGLAKKFVRKDRLKRNMRIYQALVWTGLEALRRQGVPLSALEVTTSLTVFIVAEALTVACDVGTTAVDEGLRDLRRTDLIATHRTYQEATFHKNTVTEDGEVQHQEVTMNAVTGMWVCINLRPALDGRCILLHQDLPRDERGVLIAPRDLKADRKAGRTAWQLRQESKRKESNLDNIRPWDQAILPSASLSISNRDFDEIIASSLNVLDSIDRDFADQIKNCQPYKYWNINNYSEKLQQSFTDYCQSESEVIVSTTYTGDITSYFDLMHELGHVLHHKYIPSDAQHWYRFPSRQFSEFTAQFFEFISLDHTSMFFNEPICDAVKIDTIEAILDRMVTNTILDEFQYLYYSAMAEGKDSRSPQEIFLSVSGKYQTGVDWSGEDGLQFINWQQYRIFAWPFYTIEYTIGWLLVLQYAEKYKSKPFESLVALKSAMSYGRSKSTQELLNFLSLSRNNLDDQVAAAAAYLEQEILNPVGQPRVY